MFKVTLIPGWFYLVNYSIQLVVNQKNTFTVTVDVYIIISITYKSLRIY